jgi:GntR family transcriptional regulator/MocR family aminotransferase
VDLLLTLDGTGTLADRLYRELAAAIRDRRLDTGDALPPSRELAAQLGISRSTVTLAYERLTAEGYTDARVGAGTTSPRGLWRRRGTRSAAPPKHGNPRTNGRHPRRTASASGYPT